MKKEEEKRECKYCKKEFVQKKKYQYHCSTTCKKKHGVFGVFAVAFEIVVVWV